MKKNIYLDYGATTPIDKKVLAAMMPYMTEKFGNAMSLHFFGAEANLAVEEARKKVASFFGSEPAEIIFTSGATESNNLAVKGVIGAHYHATKHGSVIPHIITTSFEHHCVLDACKRMEKEKLAEVTYIQPTKEGIIRVEDVEKAIKSNTILVSVMYVNNEIGTAQPIAEIGKLIKTRNMEHATWNMKQEKGSKSHAPYSPILFHTDATQAINYFDCDVRKLGVDLLSMSGHKIYGPKGIGALYVKSGVPIGRVQDGGGQENGKRAGTHNVPGIVGLGAAILMIEKQRAKNNKKIKGLRDYLIGKVIEEIPDVRLNGSKIKRSPNNANFSFLNVEGESLVLMLSAEGIAVSTGSACSSGSLEPSHVLLSLGLKPEQTHGSLRITIGKYTTKKEINIFISKLKKIIEQLRKVSGNVLKDYYKNKHSHVRH